MQQRDREQDQEQWLRVGQDLLFGQRQAGHGYHDHDHADQAHDRAQDMAAKMLCFQNNARA